MCDLPPPGTLRDDRSFRLIWTGQTASIFGDRVTGIALPWLILAQTQSAFDAGLVSAARYLPPVTLGLLAGVVVDRLDRRSLLIACDVGQALALAIVVALALLQLAPPLWLLAVVVLVLGLGQLFFQVAFGAWLPEVTGDRRLAKANAALEASDASATLTGPALGGLLIGLIGPALALGADSISYLLSALALARVPRHTGAHVPVRTTATPTAGVRAETLAGLRFVLSTPVQRFLKAVGASLALSSGAIELLLATLTQTRLHLAPWQAGLVFGAAGAGGLIGSVLAPRAFDQGWARSLSLTLVVATLGCLGLAWSGSLGPRGGFAMAILANFALDGASALGFILLTTAGTLVTPPAVRGRVNAVGAIYSSLLRGGSLIALGALAARGDVAWSFMVLACVFLCTAGLARWTSPANAAA